MVEYISKRILFLIPVLIGITIFVFLMRVFVPGDPVDIMLFGQPSTPEIRENLRQQLGLNEPIIVQYGIFMRGVFRGDLGNSLRSRQPVTVEIADHFPNTIRLTLASLSLAIIIGIFTGVLSAIYKDSWVDVLSMLISLIGISMPAFWLGLLLIMNVGVRVPWIPVMGSGTWRHLILPAFTLGLIASAIIARMTRSCMLDVLQKEYIRTARAKGLAEKRIIYKHALRNALIPVVTIVGMQFGYLLGGAFIIEIVFNYIGIGVQAINAIMWRDFPMIQGITLVVAFTFVMVNLAVDLLYSLLNPQIRYD